ncbi:MAG: nitroreductase family protein [Kosmotogaceae bacterium]
MSSRDDGLTDLFRISSGFSLKNENNGVINGEILKGRYSIILYIKNIDSSEHRELLSYFDNKIEAFNSHDLRFLVVSELSPKEISKLKKSSKYSLTILSLENQDELVKLGIHVNDVKDNIALLYDRWGIKRRFWKSLENKVQISEIINEAESVIRKDKYISKFIILRRARRSFRKQKVSRKDIEQLIKAAHLAPSCFNKQPWRFVAVDDRATLEKLHEYIPEGNSWMRRAPVLLIVYSTQEDDCNLSDNREYYLFDTGLAVGLLQMQATKMGLIAHPVAGYKPKKFRKELDLPEDSVLITVIAIGYQGEVSLLDKKQQKDEITGRKRKPVNSVFRWNK